MPDIFDVIADTTRRDILSLLRARDAEQAETSVSQIVEELGVSQPTVSKHLKVLREAGLAAVREEGQHRFYRIVTEPLDAVEDWLLSFFDADPEPAAEAAPAAPAAPVSLPEPAVSAASAVGRAAASAKHAFDTAFRRVSAR